MLIHERLHTEDGFTLVELLVATTMALIVFAVTLSMLGVFNDTSQALKHQNDSQNQARLGINQIVSELRDAAISSTRPDVIERATPTDLVFQTMSVDATKNTVERLRYCVGSTPGTPTSEALFVQTTTNQSLSIPSSSQCSQTTGGWSSSVLIDGLANDQSGVFSYDSSAGAVELTPTPVDDSPIYSSIKSIGVKLSLKDASQGDYELQSSALLRNAQSAPTAAFTWSQGATGKVNLDGGASYSPSDEPLTYIWSYSTNATNTDPVVIGSFSSSTFTWSPGAGTYTVTLTVTDAAGLSATSAPPQQVKVS